MFLISALNTKNRDEKQEKLRHAVTHYSCSAALRAAILGCGHSPLWKGKMRSMIRNFCPVSFLCLSILAANAGTHYLVPTNASAANPYTDWGMAGTSVIDVVNAAMTNASTPRIVLVSNGVYLLTNAVTTITNNVVIRSVNGRDTAVFDGNDLYRCFNLNHTSAVLDGLTISNGFSGSLDGGGIYITKGTITNCLVTDCVSTGGHGGGVIISPGPGTVANCTIRNNSVTNSRDAGGICASSLSTIMNSIIEYNVGVNYAGGIRMSGSTVKNCLIRYNRTGTASSHYGGGVHLDGNTGALLANCTIVSNQGGNGGGITFYSAGADPTNVVINCIIVSNKSLASASGNNIRRVSSSTASFTNAISYSCSSSVNDPIYVTIAGRGNITNDPGFINFQGENYRFNRTSPCFNSGTNQPDWMNGAVDLDGHRHILHGTADMGAYELFIPSGAMYRFR